MRQILITAIFLLVAWHGAVAQVSHATDSVKSDTVDRKLQLKEVVVTARQPSYKLTKGGVRTTVAGTELSDAGTGFDVLSMLPGVRADEGRIEVIGKGVPQIYINGRKLTDASEIERMSSKEIQSVEVVSNPGARYGAEVTSVIAIRTVRKRGDGISGSLQASERQGRYFSQTYDGSLNYRTGGVDIFGSVNFDDSRRFQSQRTAMSISTTPDNYTLASRLKIYPDQRSWHANAGVNWQIDAKNYVGLRYEYVATPRSVSKWRGSELVSINDVPEEEIERLTRWSGGNTPVNTLSMYYLGEAGPLKFNMANDYYHTHSDRRQSVAEIGSASGEREIESRSRVLSSMFASRGAVIYSRDGIELEAGYEVTSTDRKDSFLNSGAGLPDSDARIKETTGAGFVDVVVPVGRCELEGGLRYEHTVSDYYEDAVKIGEQSRRYRRLYPAVYFTFPLARARFTLSYSAKTKRPLYSQLSNSLQYDDRFTYETGNPLLVSEMIHDVSLAGIWKWIYFSAGWQYDRHAIVSVIEPYEEGSPVNVMTYRNFPHLVKYSAMLSASPKFGRWSPRLVLNLLGQHFRIPVEQGYRQMDSPVLFWNIYNSLSLGRGFTATADITGRTSGSMDVVTLKPSWQINLGVTKNIGGWFLQLQLTDMLRTARGSMITYGSRMTLSKWNYSDTQGLRLMVRYAFNTPLSRYKGRSAGLTEKQRL